MLTPTTHAHTVVKPKWSRPTISPPSRPPCLSQNLLSPSTQPFSSLQILTALPRYQTLQIHSRSPRDSSPKLPTNSRKLNRCEDNGDSLSLKAGILRSSQRPALHRGKQSTPAHSLDGKDVSGWTEEAHASQILITSSPAEVHAGPAEG